MDNTETQTGHTLPDNKAGGAHNETSPLGEGDAKSQDMSSACEEDLQNAPPAGGLAPPPIILPRRSPGAMNMGKDRYQAELAILRGVPKSEDADMDGISPSTSHTRSMTVLPAIHESPCESEEELESRNSSLFSPSSLSAVLVPSSPSSGSNKSASLCRVSSRPALTSISEEEAAAAAAKATLQEPGETPDRHNESNAESEDDCSVLSDAADQERRRAFGARGRRNALFSFAADTKDAADQSCDMSKYEENATICNGSVLPGHNDAKVPPNSPCNEERVSVVERTQLTEEEVNMKLFVSNYIRGLTDDANDKKPTETAKVDPEVEKDEKSSSMSKPRNSGSATLICRNSSSPMSRETRSDHDVTSGNEDRQDSDSNKDKDSRGKHRDGHHCKKPRGREREHKQKRDRDEKDGELSRDYSYCDLNKAVGDVSSDAPNSVEKSSSSSSGDDSKTKVFIEANKEHERKSTCCLEYLSQDNSESHSNSASEHDRVLHNSRFGKRTSSHRLKLTSADQGIQSEPGQVDGEDHVKHDDPSEESRREPYVSVMVRGQRMRVNINDPAFHSVAPRAVLDTSSNHPMELSNTSLTELSLTDSDSTNTMSINEVEDDQQPVSAPDQNANISVGEYSTSTTETEINNNRLSQTDLSDGKKEAADDELSLSDDQVCSAGDDSSIDTTITDPITNTDNNIEECSKDSGVDLSLTQKSSEDITTCAYLAAMEEETRHKSNEDSPTACALQEQTKESCNESSHQLLQQDRQENVTDDLNTSLQSTCSEDSETASIPDESMIPVKILSTKEENMKLNRSAKRRLLRAKKKKSLTTMNKEEGNESVVVTEIKLDNTAQNIDGQQGNAGLNTDRHQCDIDVKEDAETGNTETEISSIPETEIAIQERDSTIKETESTIPETEIAIPETECTIPETENTIPETECTIPETECTIPETENTIPETEGTIPETENTVPETENTVPERTIKDITVTTKEDSKASQKDSEASTVERDVILKALDQLVPEIQEAWKEGYQMKDVHVEVEMEKRCSKKEYVQQTECQQIVKALNEERITISDVEKCENDITEQNNEGSLITESESIQTELEQNVHEDKIDEIQTQPSCDEVNVCETDVASDKQKTNNEGSTSEDGRFAIEEEKCDDRKQVQLEVNVDLDEIDMQKSPSDDAVIKGVCDEGEVIKEVEVDLEKSSVNPEQGVEQTIGKSAEDDKTEVVDNMTSIRAWIRQNHEQIDAVRDAIDGAFPEIQDAQKDGYHLKNIQVDVQLQKEAPSKVEAETESKVILSDLKVAMDTSGLEEGENKNKVELEENIAMDKNLTCPTNADGCGIAIRDALHQSVPEILDAGKEGYRVKEILVELDLEKDYGKTDETLSDEVDLIVQVEKIPPAVEEQLVVEGTDTPTHENNQVEDTLMKDDIVHVKDGHTKVVTIAEIHGEQTVNDIYKKEDKLVKEVLTEADREAIAIASHTEDVQVAYKQDCATCAYSGPAAESFTWNPDVEAKDSNNDLHTDEWSAFGYWSHELPDELRFAQGVAATESCIDGGEDKDLDITATPSPKIDILTCGADVVKSTASHGALVHLHQEPSENTMDTINETVHEVTEVPTSAAKPPDYGGARPKVRTQSAAAPKEKTSRASLDPSKATSPAGCRYASDSETLSDNELLKSYGIVCNKSEYEDYIQKDCPIDDFRMQNEVTCAPLPTLQHGKRLELVDVSKFPENKPNIYRPDSEDVTKDKIDDKTFAIDELQYEDLSSDILDLSSFNKVSPTRKTKSSSLPKKLDKQLIGDMDDRKKKGVWKKLKKAVVTHTPGKKQKYALKENMKDVSPVHQEVRPSAYTRTTATLPNTPEHTLEKQQHCPRPARPRAKRSQSTRLSSRPLQRANTISGPPPTMTRHRTGSGENLLRAVTQAGLGAKGAAGGAAVIVDKLTAAADGLDKKEVIITAAHDDIHVGTKKGDLSVDAADRHGKHGMCLLM